MAILYNVNDQSYLGDVHLPDMCDTTGMDANAFPPSVIGYDGHTYLINPALPEGAEGWGYVIYADGALRTRTPEEMPAPLDDPTL